MYQKFIVTDDGHLRFGTVFLHRELLQPGEECTGGGLWLVNEEQRMILLFGRSFDFGAPDFADIRVIEWSSLKAPQWPIYYVPHYPDVSTLEPVYAHS